MKLKVYRARSMADALAEVKRDLGADAVILHTKHAKTGGILGVGARTIVEVTASNDPKIVATRRPMRARTPARPATQDVPTPAGGPAAIRAYGAPRDFELSRAEPSRTDPRPKPNHAVPEVPVVGGEPLASTALIDRPKVSPRPIKADASEVPPSIIVSPDSRLMRDELDAIKRMVGQVLRVQRDPASCGDEPDALLRHYLRLTENAVATELADQIIGRVRSELSPAELSQDDVVRQRVLRELASMMPVATASPPPTRNDKGGPTTIALVGPTGVGKTTTVAKLAATYKLRHGRRVGLITADTYRIAAVDQLRTYADIIGIPMKTVMTPLEMGAARASLAECDVVLIDTAGRSPRDAGRLTELGESLRQARPDETHLVISSTSCPRAVEQIAERFSALRPDRVVFTKLDEAVNLGVLLTVARKLDLKTSFLTNGQEVPDHIDAARSDRLARLVLDGPEDFDVRAAS